MGTKLTFNVLGLANAITSKQWCTNPFVHNTVGLCTILKKYGHHVRFFGAEGSELDCDEMFAVVEKSELERAYGPDFHEQKIDLNDHPSQYPHELYTARAKQILREVSKPNEFLLTMAGPPHKEICDALSDAEFKLHVVEPAAGYTDAFCKFRVWPSSAWKHVSYGRYHENWTLRTAEMTDAEKFAPENLLTISQPFSWHKVHDAVIPHYIFPDSFQPAEKRDDYMLQISRVIPSKGIEMAVRVSQHLGRKLIIAGHGDFEKNMGFKPPQNVELIGPVLFEERRDLIAQAHCMMAWTIYPESFGLSPIEANMGDCPSVTSQEGAYIENIEDGVNGFKTRTFKKTCEAVEQCGKLGKGKIRKHTIAHFSVDTIAPQYEEYFQDLNAYLEADAEGEGFYHLRG